MTCFKNYIQIEGCAAPTYTYTVNGSAATPSGLFINRHLPIPLKQIDKIANEEQVTFLGVWNDVQDRGIQKFIIRVKTGYKELFGVCNGIDDAWLCSNREFLAMPLLYFLGSELMQERLWSDRINRYTTIDKDRATEMKAELDAEFQLQLKAALEAINAGVQEEAGEVFTIIESLP